MNKETVPIKEGLFIEKDGKACIIIGKCQDCSTPNFPYQPWCLNCGSSNVKEVAVCEEGKLRNFTAVLHNPPESKMPVPYGMANVDFPEHQIRISGLSTESDVSKLKPGMDVKIIIDKVYEEDGRDVISYKFQPIGR